MRPTWSRFTDPEDASCNIRQNVDNDKPHTSENQFNEDTHCIKNFNHLFNIVISKIQFEHMESIYSYKCYFSKRKSADEG